MHIDDDDWLCGEAGGAPVRKVPTVRTCPLLCREPKGLVWHTTGGPGGQGWSERLVRRIQTYRRGVDRPASFHVCVARNGEVFVTAPFSKGTWHVGQGAKIGDTFFDNVNHGTIGVEIENAGRLIECDGRFYAWPYWIDPAAPSSARKPDPRYRVPWDRVARLGNDELWETFPSIQERAATELVEAIVRRFRWRSRSAVSFAHSDFAAPRKLDPGPLWMKAVLPRVLDSVFGASPDSSQQSQVRS